MLTPVLANIISAYIPRDTDRHMSVLANRPLQTLIAVARRSMTAVPTTAWTYEMILRSSTRFGFSSR
jgi:hypothetical protein